MNEKSREGGKRTPYVQRSGSMNAAAHKRRREGVLVRGCCVNKSKSHKYKGSLGKTKNGGN